MALPGLSTHVAGHRLEFPRLACASGTTCHSYSSTTTTSFPVLASSYCSARHGRKYTDQRFEYCITYMYFSNYSASPARVLLPVLPPPLPPRRPGVHTQLPPPTVAQHPHMRLRFPHRHTRHLSSPVCSHKWLPPLALSRSVLPLVMVCRACCSAAPPVLRRKLRPPLLSPPPFNSKHTRPRVLAAKARPRVCDGPIRIAALRLRNNLHRIHEVPREG